tara:strand:- start:1699 stop:2124 length:426 start_codon:yes stop_codon:yes gene_type:complete
MKQLFKNVLGIAGIILFLGIVYASLNAIQAEDNKNLPLYDKGKLQVRQVPLYCGYTGFIFQTAFETFGEQPIAGAEVRAKGNPETPVIGLLTFTYNKDNNKGTFMITLPDTGETCILGYGMNWEFFPVLKEILDEGNESKQ